MPNNCIALVNCKTGVPCPERARNATPESEPRLVYCDKHYDTWKSGREQVCNQMIKPTMNQVARFVAASYSPRSSRCAGSPVSRAAMSPRSSATTNYTKPVSPRFQQDFQNDYEVEGSNEGFNAGSNLRKKNTIRPKSLFTRRNTAPNFTTEEGSVKLLFIIDETDDVNEAIANLRKFKLIVFAADMNTTNKPDDFEERARVTEDIVNKTAEILSEYMNNPMRIELVLSFLYDYDTRDLDVDFGYFGFRNPKSDILLDTTLDEYIEQNYKNGKWYEYPTPDVREDYDRDTMEQTRKEISDLIKTWTDKPGQSEFNKLLKNLRNQLTNTKFIVSIATKNYQDAKILWDQITRTTQQQRQGVQGRNAFTAAGPTIQNTPGPAVAVVGVNGSPVAPLLSRIPSANATNLSFTDVTKVYVDAKKLTQEQVNKLNTKLTDTEKTSIAQAVGNLRTNKNDIKYGAKQIGEIMVDVAEDKAGITANDIINKINQLAGNAAAGDQKKPQQPPQQGQQNRNRNRSQSRNNKQRK